MKEIQVSTDVFAKIWSLRIPEENTEDEILRRLLGCGDVPAQPIASNAIESKRLEDYEMPRRKIRWVDDVRTALQNLGGRAHLSKIYAEVRLLRKAGGRSIVAKLEEVVRKELETHSSDSNVYQHREDYFYMPEGKGAGIWGLR
jgi:hypothetical protein